MMHGTMLPRWGNFQETRTPCGQFVSPGSSPSHSTSHVSASYSFSAHTAPSALWQNQSPNNPVP